MLRTIRALTLALGLMLIPTTALAGPATDLLKAKQTALAGLLKTKSAENTRKINAIFDELLDYNALAEASLGSEWANRSDDEKTQFTDLLKQLVRKSYERNLKKTLGYDVEYVSEEAADGKVKVVTKAKNRGKEGEEPIEIAYKLAERDGTHRVNDIITEGVSMVGSYRSQFVKIIKKDGFPKLIQKMKDKLAKGDVLAAARLADAPPRG